jgi:indolepyruvate ferredoxin oxidoreductase beta subunit
MKRDIIVAGVGGQGVLSIAAIVAAGAMRTGLRALQSEVHGMSQRGGAVVAHLRLSDELIHSCTISRGRADMIISMEPMESLRYTEYLAPTAVLLSATDPVRNIPEYPELEQLFARIRSMPDARLIDATRIAREAGSAKAANMVMVGAASHLLPIGHDPIRAQIEESFRAKGEKLVRINLDAFEAGIAAARVADELQLIQA